MQEARKARSQSTDGARRKPLPFAFCLLPFAFQTDLMFAVGLRPFEKQKEKARKAHSELAF
jgi:hypothetical protein